MNEDKSSTKLVVPPPPVLSMCATDMIWATRLQLWGQECAAIAQREAALADELAEALERAKKMLGPHSLNPDAEGYLMVECALDRFAKHKEARNPKHHPNCCDSTRPIGEGMCCCDKEARNG